MILIPAGEFLMGSDPQQDEDAVDNEQPQHLLYLPDYYLAKTPVTHGQYREFVQASGHRAPYSWTNNTPPRSEEDHPVVNVSWFDARDYCQWLSEATGRRYSLPSEAEWEKGARGIDGRIYPWSNEWEASRCNSFEGKRGETKSVHTYPHGASPYGVLNMTGNVWEWTRSLWGEYPYPSDAIERAQREDLQAPNDQVRVLRGGSFDDYRRDVRCAYRYTFSPFERLRFVGFRVVVRPAS
jgi:formylglycine-generating enzyme required for sulfatase activity